MKNPIVLAIAAVVIAAVAFWGGTYYQNQQATNRAAAFRSQFGGGGQGGNPGQNGQPASAVLNGKIDKIDNNEITMTTRAGSQKVTVDSKTKVNITTQSTLDMIKAGDTVFISGVRQSDNSINATSVTQMNIVGSIFGPRGGFGGGGQGGGGFGGGPRGGSGGGNSGGGKRFQFGGGGG